MANYYLDTEFLEGPQKKRFLGIPYGETSNTIDLISIGLVSEDGREYYALNKDCNLWEAWNRFDVKEDFGKPQGLGDKRIYWIRDNVLLAIYMEHVSGDLRNYLDFSLATMRWIFNKYGKSRDQIASEIKDFVCMKAKLHTPGILTMENGVTSEFLSTYDGRMALIKQKWGGVNFYGYYSDYDWVVFCWIFGRMIDLPGGFPMYCKDLKQMLDEVQERRFSNREVDGKLVNDIKRLPNYPAQQNEHNALYDAKWNKKLHEFIKQL